MSWNPNPNDPNFMNSAPPRAPRPGQTKTPCCGDTGGYLRTNPNGDFCCSQCGTLYTTTDLLNMTGNPVKPSASGGIRMVPVTGNTYPVKDELKMLGARWNAQGRVWMVPESRLLEAQRLVIRGPMPNNPPWTTPGQQQGPGKPPGKWRSEYETEEERKFQEYRETAKRHAMERRVCWECASPFTEAHAAAANGAWDEYWCGCSDKPRLKK